jgi:putative transposase
MIRTTFEYRIEPDEAQRLRLDTTLEVCRHLYNNGLSQRREAWKLEKTGLTYADQCRMLPTHKPLAEPIRNVHSQVLQQTLKRLDRAFENFFRRCQEHAREKGYPRFKSESRFHSFVFPQWGNGVKIVGDRLFLSKIGEVKVRWHRPLQGIPKQCTLKREGDHWYACIVSEGEPVPLPPTGKSVGIDLGLTDFATFSDDSPPLPNPRFLRKTEAKLVKAQQKVSRRQRNKGKGRQSNRYHKAKKALAKLHRHVARCRKDFAHKQARKLVHRYEHIGVEDLGIGNMLKNHQVAKSISDAGWGLLVRFLMEKAERATNRVVTLVNPYNSTQECFRCGKIVRKALWERWHSCPYCGFEAPRDKNSALIVEKRSLQKILSPVERTGRDTVQRKMSVGHRADTESLTPRKEATPF